MWCRWSDVPVRRARGLHRVQRHPHRPVADRVHVHLEAVGVELGEGGLEQLGVDVREPAVVGVTAAPVAVGLEHRAGVVLQHAVGHDLDRGRVEARRAAGLAQGAQLVDLLEAASPVPPQRRDHPAGELPAVGQRPVSLHRLRGHPGVLPAGDAERVQVPLRLEDAFLPAGPVRCRHQPGLVVVRRALVQGPGRLTGRGVALDPAVGRVGGVAVDAGDLERLAVDPGAVHVAVHQEDRPVGDDRVEVLLARRAAGKVLHRPAAAGDPRLVRVRCGVRGDGGQVALPLDGVVEPQPVELAARHRCVHVRVLEAGQHLGAAGLHHPGAGADQRVDLFPADRHHAVAAGRDGVGRRAVRVPGPHPRVDDREVCLARLTSHRRSRPHLPPAHHPTPRSSARYAHPTPIIRAVRPPHPDHPRVTPTPPRSSARYARPRRGRSARMIEGS